VEIRRKKITQNKIEILAEGYYEENLLKKKKYTFTVFGRWTREVS